MTKLDEHGRTHGFHRRLGPDHGALFTEDDDVLIVTFETEQAIRAAQIDLPWGLTVAGREGWSQLCLYSRGDTFFRDRDVYEFFDELIDTGFFDRFNRVVFYGAGPCGYAAAAYSVSAPGSTAVLLRPLATLDPARAEWDRRYMHLRRISFTDRYAYAPLMLEAAERAFILYDPEIAEDAMHAALFNVDEACRLRCRRLGPALEVDLEAMGILGPILRAAGKDSFSNRMFYRLYRRRRGYRAYLNRIFVRLRRDNRHGLKELWSRGVRAAPRSLGQRRANG